MNLSHPARLGALLICICATAIAQEDPASVYARLHSAALAGNAEEAIGYATAAQRDRLAGKSRGERDAIVQAMAGAMPRAYSITSTLVSADGNSAQMQGTGRSPNGPMTLNAQFLRQDGAWKVEMWEWTNDAPVTTFVPEPAMARASAPAEPQSPPAPVSYEPRTVPQLEVFAPARRVHADRDARACLNLPDQKAMVRCAEKFR